MFLYLSKLSVLDFLQFKAKFVRGGNKYKNMTIVSSFEATTKKKPKPLYSDTPLLYSNIDAISVKKVKPRVYYLHSVNALRIKNRRRVSLQFFLL